MTCIAAIVADGQVHMAADSCGSNGYTYTIHRNKKIFLVGELLIGFTTSFRMGQLLQHYLEVPPLTDDLDRYMIRDFTEKVRELFKKHGWHTHDPQNPSSNGGNFLVGVRGRLFEINTDFGVIEHQRSYAAIGSGGAHAEGSLHATQQLKIPVRIKLHSALLAAADHSNDVRQPFTYLETPNGLAPTPDP